MEKNKITSKPKPTRWWPAIVILGVFALTLGLVLYAMSEDQASRALTILGATTLTSILLLAWMLFFSRLPKRTRLLNFGGLVGAIVLFSTCFRFSQFSGNMIPMFEWRWIRNTLPTAATHATNPNNNSLTKLSFPQFLGPNRDCKVIGPDLATDWTTQSPEKLWRQPIGPAWSGFVIAGSRAVTQEQRGQNEAVVCYDLQTGTVLWQQTNVGHYKTAIAGEGPRATPTIHDSKVYTLGASGMLNCLELATGKPVWQRSVVTDAGLNVDETIDQIGILDNRNKSKEWGYSCSPLILKNLVIEDCTVEGSGGGISALYAHWEGIQSNLILDNIRFFNNTATGSDSRGGGLHLFSGEGSLLTNLTFSNNISHKGGGIHLQSNGFGTIDIHSSTFYNNISTGSQGSSIWARSVDKVNIYNSIF